MFENIKAVVCDIDGTLATAGADPSPYTIETLEELRNRGILIALASGRPADDVMLKYKKWGMDRQFDFIIGWNGCEVYDDKTKEIYRYNKLKKEWIREIIEFMAEFKAAIHMYRPGIFISSDDTDRAWYSAYKNSRTYIVEPDVSAFYSEDNCGIMFRYDLSEEEKIREKLKTLKDKDYIAFNTQVDLLEFSHKDSSKGYALKEYCRMYDIDLKDVMAFGDTDNDNEMLKICVGVCLCDGKPDTVKLCRYVTAKPCYEDGFADFVQRNLL